MHRLGSKQLYKAVALNFLFSATAFACSVAIDPGGEQTLVENDTSIEYFVVTVLALLAINVALPFFFKRRFSLGVGLAVLSIPAQLILFAGAMVFSDSCFLGFKAFVWYEFLFLMLGLVIQLIVFLYFRRKANTVVLP